MTTTRPDVLWLDTRSGEVEVGFDLGLPSRLPDGRRVFLTFDDADGWTVRAQVTSGGAAPLTSCLFVEVPGDRDLSTLVDVLAARPDDLVACFQGDLDAALDLEEHLDDVLLRAWSAASWFADWTDPADVEGATLDEAVAGEVARAADAGIALDPAEVRSTLVDALVGMIDPDEDADDLDEALDRANVARRLLGVPALAVRPDGSDLRDAHLDRARWGHD